LPISFHRRGVFASYTYVHAAKRASVHRRKQKDIENFPVKTVALRLEWG